MRQISQHPRELNEKLQAAPHNRSPREIDGQLVLRGEAAEGDKRRDHRDIQSDGSGIGEQKAVMAIEDAQAPRAHHQQTGAREQNPNDMDSKLAFLSTESRGNDVDEKRREQDAQNNQDGADNGKQAEYRAREMIGLLLPLLGQQLGIHRDEGGREDAFTESVVQQ